MPHSQRHFNIAPKLFIGLILMAAFAGAGSFLLAGALAQPQLQRITPPDTSLPLIPVKIPTAQGYAVAGWFVKGQQNKPGVLLLHRIRANRLEMVERAEFLHQAGYSVLLIDLQAHGETPGEQITFGYRESIDAHAALDFLKVQLPDQKLGVIGVSLGGAAALLGHAPLKADALVLESVYSTIEKAIENRLLMRFGEIGRHLSPLLEWQLEPRLGVPASALAPLNAIPALNSPVMIIAGDKDRHTRPEETEALFKAAPQPKALWLIEEAGHEDLHRFAPAAYEQRVLAFLQQHLEDDQAQ